MASYGFPFDIYFELLSKAAYLPDGNAFYDEYLGNPGVTYNTSAPFLGYPSYYNSTNCSLNSGNVQTHQGYPNWYSPVTNKVDLRAAYVTCGNCPLSNGYCPIFKDWPAYSEVEHTKSPITGV